MIFLFRKEIRKWNKIWWFVIASLGLGSASVFFMRGPDKGGITIAEINGKTISLKTYHQTLSELRSSLDYMAMSWGISPEQLASLMGIRNFPQNSLEKCKQDAVLSDLADEFSIRIDEGSFQTQLAEGISKAFIDTSGKVNIQAYQNYLSRLNMSVFEFEKNKEEEFRRNLALKLVAASGHVPNSVLNELTEQKTSKKSFEVMLLPIDHFVGEAKKDSVTPEELKKFFKEKQELYRVPEKKKVKYIVVTPKQYRNKAVVDEDRVEKFYEQNKTSLYRIPPRVKVRVIVFKEKDTANKFHTELIASPSDKRFIEIAKKHSIDKGTARKGGLTDFFSRSDMSEFPVFARTAFIGLKKPGDISKVVKTKRGFEIIKLAERISAAEKPLKQVRDDVVKKLKKRRALFLLRSDLQAVARSASHDPEIFEKFTSENKFKVNESGWLEKGKTNDDDAISALSKRIFSDRNKSRSHGYFVLQGKKHLLYKVVDRQKSKISDFETVKSSVEKDWYEEKAARLQRNMVKKLKKEFLAGKTSLADLGNLHGLKVVKTSLVKKEDSVDSLKNEGDVIEDAFLLSDKQQILEHKHKQNYHLASLISSEKIEGETEIGELTKRLSNVERTTTKTRYSAAFIASLLRNARIKINEEVWNVVSTQ